MKPISESINTVEGVVPNLQDRIMYNQFDNGVQPIVFQDAIIKQMDLIPPPSPTAPIIPAPQINNNITPQVQYTPQPQSSGIPVLDLKPVDSESLYYTEPSSDPSSNENIKNNIEILSTYFILDEARLIRNKTTYDNSRMINAIEILKLRILNEKKVLGAFTEFIRKFNNTNDKSRRLELYCVHGSDDTEGDVLFLFNDTDNKVKYWLTVFDANNIEYDTDENSKKYCINTIQFHFSTY